MLVWSPTRDPGGSIAAATRRTPSTHRRQAADAGFTPDAARTRTATRQTRHRRINPRTDDRPPPPGKPDTAGLTPAGAPPPAN